MRRWPIQVSLAGALLLLAAALVAWLAGPASQDRGDPAPRAAGSGSGPASGPSAAPAPCSGVARRDVVGQPPAFARGPLAPFPNDDAVCRALWLPRFDDWFVPQGLALEGRTAWISGYEWRARVGTKYCGVLRVDLRTGRELAFQPRLRATLPGGEQVVCRHGGGAMRTRHGLWVAEKVRLWLLDPERLGTDGAVRRVWSIGQRASGGFLVAGERGEFALGDFRRARHAKAHWFRIDDVLREPVTTLVGGAATGEGQLSATRTSRTPRYAQGGALSRADVRRPHLVASTSTCGALQTPEGAELGFAPGAEGIALDGRGGLWAALESGSRPYQQVYGDRPLTPGLVRFDLGQLLAGEGAACSWLE